MVPRHEINKIEQSLELLLQGKETMPAEIYDLLFSTVQRFNKGGIAKDDDYYAALENLEKHVYAGIRAANNPPADATAPDVAEHGSYGDQEENKAFENNDSFFSEFRKALSSFGELLYQIVNMFCEMISVIFSAIGAFFSSLFKDKAPEGVDECVSDPLRSEDFPGIYNPSSPAMSYAEGRSNTRSYQEGSVFSDEGYAQYFPAKSIQGQEFDLDDFEESTTTSCKI